jgi:hypothetical protein
MLSRALSADNRVIRLSRLPALSSARKRGRPSKFGRPSRLVAATLPEEVIQGLRKVHPDLAWAIVSLFENRAPFTAGADYANAELVDIGGRESLIVIDRSTLKRLPGVDIVPLAENRALLALEPGCGMSDLETAVTHGLERATPGEPGRGALQRFRKQLQAWRRDDSLRFHTRAIIVVERVRPASTDNGRARVERAAGRKPHLKRSHR